MTAKIFSLASFLSFCCCKDHTFLVWPEKILKKWLQLTEIFFFCSFCHSFVISSFSALWISRQIIPSYWLFFEHFFSLPKSSLPAVLSIIKKWADFKMTEALLDQLWRWNGSTNLFFFSVLKTIILLLRNCYKSVFYKSKLQVILTLLLK